MQSSLFYQMAEARLQECLRVMAVKDAEYQRDDDKLHNFKRAAAMDGTTPIRSLWGMWKKHLVSIMDMVDDCDAGRWPSPEMVREKLGDNINYTLLLEALITEAHAEALVVGLSRIPDEVAVASDDDGGRTVVGSLGDMMTKPGTVRGVNA